MVAILGARFYFTPVNEEKGWKGMESFRNRGAASVLLPTQDVGVNFKRRSGHDGLRTQLDI